MAPLKTLSIGGATYDIFVHIDPSVDGDTITLPIGSKLHIKSVTETCGGGAANTSVGLARLGCKACFCGVMGDDQWGKRMRESLTNEGVDTRCATVVEHENSGFSIVLLLPNGERTILNYPGVNRHLDDVTFDVGALEAMDVVYLNRLSEDACEIENDIIARFSQLKDTFLAWNPGGCQIETGMDQADKKALLTVTNLILLNKEEALTFTGEKDIRSAMKTLVDAGVLHVCITDGKVGAYASDGKETYHVKASEDVSIIDATGAGDAFGTGMTWAICNGESLPNALKAGTLNAISVLQEIGAQAGLLTDTEIKEEMRTSKLSVETLDW